MREEDEKKIIAQSWNQLSLKLFKEGFRLGSVAGQNKNFQKGFDIGYKEGFKVGFHMANFNGILRTLKHNLAVPINVTVGIYTKPYIGLCNLCDNSDTNDDTKVKIDVTQKSLNDVVTNQQLIVRNETNLRETFISQLLTDFNIVVSLP
uniref:Essential protein Yae1 N-terminal domain-containing protein n=1 Tax=Clastoptera arizonana TaxID=38151 RepID=A0A1B6CMV9_9HEMI